MYLLEGLLLRCGPMFSSFPSSQDATPDRALPGTFWIDLVQPTAEEIARVKSEFGIEVPSRGQLEEIESSSRLRVRGKTLFLSMPLSAQHEVLDSAPAPVGFVLSPELLVTVRYSELPSFSKVRKGIAEDSRCYDSTSTFATLLEEMVDFSADLLEKIASDLGGVSRRVFRRSDPHAHRGFGLNRLLREKLAVVGDAGEHLSQIRESLTGLQRIVGFAAETAAQWLPQDIPARLKTMRQDLTSLIDFEAHLSGKAQFLLDAILGFINTEQNEIFKVLTIASVVGIPPTLIASMYGMNFHNMPELSWRWGYQFGLGLILLSTIVPILWFKWRRWW
jgi:magnesium transporter